MTSAGHEALKRRPTTPTYWCPTLDESYPRLGDITVFAKIFRKDIAVVYEGREKNIKPVHSS